MHQTSKVVFFRMKANDPEPRPYIVRVCLVDKNVTQMRLQLGIKFDQRLMDVSKQHCLTSFVMTLIYGDLESVWVTRGCFKEAIKNKLSCMCLLF